MLSLDKRIYSKKMLKRFINIEMEKYGVRTINTLFPFRENDVLAKHNILLRKTEYNYNLKHKLRYLFYRIRLNRIQNKYAIHIPINCCDEGLKIMHLGSVLLNANTIVGKNCIFHINTALVAGGTNSDSPKIGNGVVIGVGAVVVGGVTVADNVAIGANAVVNKDVLEENITVAGVPAKKISNNGRLQWNNGKI